MTETVLDQDKLYDIAREVGPTRLATTILNRARDVLYFDQDKRADGDVPITEEGLAEFYKGVYHFQPRAKKARSPFPDGIGPKQVLITSQYLGEQGVLEQPGWLPDDLSTQQENDSYHEAASLTYWDGDQIVEQQDSLIAGVDMESEELLYCDLVEGLESALYRNDGAPDYNAVDLWDVVSYETGSIEIR